MIAEVAGFFVLVQAVQALCRHLCRRFAVQRFDFAAFSRVVQAVQALHVRASGRARMCAAQACATARPARAGDAYTPLHTRKKRGGSIVWGACNRLSGACTGACTARTACTARIGGWR